MECECDRSRFDGYVQRMSDAIAGTQRERERTSVSHSSSSIGRRIARSGRTWQRHSLSLSLSIRRLRHMHACRWPLVGAADAPGSGSELFGSGDARTGSTGPPAIRAGLGNVGFLGSKPFKKSKLRNIQAGRKKIIVEARFVAQSAHEFSRLCTSATELSTITQHCSKLSFFYYFPEK